MKGRISGNDGQAAERLTARIEDWQDAGVSHWKSAKPSDNSNSAAASDVKNDDSGVNVRGPRRGLSLSSADGPTPIADDSRQARAEALTVIQKEVAGCQRCAELAATRTQTVFGVGNPQARLCFMGEAPGADEDRKGEPFVGRAGQLLTKIIEACTLRREDVYILNTLKCRPPGNRNPLPDEVRNCREFLDRQLEVIRPEFICCLGAVAAQALLNVTTPIGRLRGKFHDYQGVEVLCTYHPAYLLRNPAAKKDTWDDMKLLMSAMGIVLPS